MDLYKAYNIISNDEIILGLLSQFEFESFEEVDNLMIAYIKSDHLTDEVKKEIHTILDNRNVTFTVEDIEPQNWNSIWEASFQPVIVNDFCQIRADFHPPIDGIKYDLVINPKMAFGTGHHATTFMMVDMMSRIDVKNKLVFDFGCGTGILAILASKLGAAYIDAVDIEEESYSNTIENALVNDVQNINPFCGDLNVVPPKKYDIILANINRNILLKYSLQLSQRISQHGQLLLSGILLEDEKIVIDAFRIVGFEYVTSHDRDGWKCIWMAKS